MAHFRAWIRGMRGEASRLGSKNSGIKGAINGWSLGVSVRGYFDEKNDTDAFEIELTGGSNGGNSVSLGRFTREDLDKAA